MRKMLPAGSRDEALVKIGDLYGISVGQHFGYPAERLDSTPAQFHVYLQSFQN